MVNKSNKRGRPTHGVARKVSITLRVQPGLLERLRCMAKVKNVPYQSLIQDGLEDYVYSTEIKESVSKFEANPSEYKTAEDFFRSLSGDCATSYLTVSGAVALEAGPRNYNKIMLRIKELFRSVKEQSINETKKTRKNQSVIRVRLQKCNIGAERLVRDCRILKNDLLANQDIRAKPINEALKILEKVEAVKSEAELNFNNTQIVNYPARELIELIIMPEGVSVSNRNEAELRAKDLVRRANERKAILRGNKKTRRDAEIDILTKEEFVRLIDKLEVAIKKSSANLKKIK